MDATRMPCAASARVFAPSSSVPPAAALATNPAPVRAHGSRRGDNNKRKNTGGAVSARAVPLSRTEAERISRMQPVFSLHSVEALRRSLGDRTGV